MSTMDLTALFSLDSFVACVGLSSIWPPGRWRYYLPIAFGVCDGSATLLSTSPEILTLALSIAVLSTLLLGTPGLRISFHMRLLVALPLALSIDNLLDPTPQSAAFAFGVSSSVWSCLGLLVGRIARDRRWFNS